jgi:hypothetical protein
MAGIKRALALASIPNQLTYTASDGSMAILKLISSHTKLLCRGKPWQRRQVFLVF